MNRHPLSRIARQGSPAIGEIRIDAVMPGKQHRPVVIEELPGKKVGLREAIALGRVMTIVVMCSEEVIAEAAIRLELDRQCVVMTKDDPLLPITRTV